MGVKSHDDHSRLNVNTILATISISSSYESIVAKWSTTQKLSHIANTQRQKYNKLIP